MIGYPTQTPPIIAQPEQTMSIPTSVANAPEAQAPVAPTGRPNLQQAMPPWQQMQRRPLDPAGMPNRLAPPQAPTYNPQMGFGGFSPYGGPPPWMQQQPPPWMQQQQQQFQQPQLPPWFQQMAPPWMQGGGYGGPPPYAMMPQNRPMQSPWGGQYQSPWGQMNQSVPMNGGQAAPHPAPPPQPQQAAQTPAPAQPKPSPGQTPPIVQNPYQTI